MKRIVCLAMTMLFFCGSIIAQSTAYASGVSRSAVKRVVNGNTTYGYITENTYSFGNYTDEYYRNRCFYWLDIPSTIPVGSQIYRADLEYTFTVANNFDIVLVDQSSNYLNYYTAESLWLAIENGSDVTSVQIPSSKTGSVQLSNAFVQAISGNFQNNYYAIKFGIKATDESPLNGSNSASSIRIKIYYLSPTNITINSNYTTCSNIVNDTLHSSGYVLHTLETKTVTLSAHEPQGSSSEYAWNDTEFATQKSTWVRHKGYINTEKTQNISYSFIADTTDNNAQYIANYRIIYNATVGMTTASGDKNGTLSIDNTNTTVPNITKKLLGDSIKVEVINTTFSIGQGTWLDYTFNHWVVNGAGGTTSTSIHVPVNTPSIIKAYYKAKPSNGYKNMSYSGNTGDYITLNWNAHPDSNVSYQIWRRVRHLGVTGSDELIGTVNHGTTTFTDYEYLYTGTFTDDLLWYDVRAYYSPDETYADAEFVAVYGKMDVSKLNDDKVAAKTAENLSIAPTEYSLGSYPNPFNPTTVIRYTMPEAGQVSLKVYNILSQEVANLVESNQSAGIHQVNFNASHLPTGIYIARLQAGAKVMTAKLQLVK